MASEMVDVKCVLKRALPLSAIAAAGINAVLHAVVTRALDLPLFVAQGPEEALEPLSLGAVIGASVVPAVAGAGLLVLLGRFVRRPATVFTIVSVVVLVASLAGPLNVAVNAAHTRWVLATMHVTAAASIVSVLNRLGIRDAGGDGDATMDSEGQRRGRSV